MQVRLHRSEREAQRLGHLLIGELLHVAKGERSAIRGRKLFHRSDDLRELLAADRGRLGSFLDLLGTLGQLLDRCLSRAPTLDVVEARVCRDSVEPRTEGQRGVVLVECAIGANESLLCAVFCRVGVGGDPKRDVEDAASVSLDEGRVCVRVTSKTRLDDVLVGVGQRSLRRSGQEVASFGLPPRPSPCFAYSRPVPWT